MISRESRIMFVNDGSKDRTWEMIEELLMDREVIPSTASASIFFSGYLDSPATRSLRS